MLETSNMLIEMYNNMFESDNKSESVRRQISKAIGVLVCLVGAFLMGWGSPFLGENHTGIATIVGIIGIGIITSSKNPAPEMKRKEEL